MIAVSAMTAPELSPHANAPTLSTRIRSPSIPESDGVQRKTEITDVTASLRHTVSKDANQAPRDRPSLAVQNIDCDLEGQKEP